MTAASSFLGLTNVSRSSWRMPVTPELSTPGGFLFGGAGLAAAVEALERTTGRPLIWATAQYLNYGRPPGELQLEVTEVVVGHQVTQARVVAQIDEQEILTVNAALGARPIGVRGTWEQPPSVPPPEECEQRDMPADLTQNTIFERIDVRRANARSFAELDGTKGDGRSALWARLPVPIDPSASVLALLGDFVPYGFAQAVGDRLGGNSLDNTIRVGHLVPAEWVLLDIRVHAIANGFGHGLVHMWAENGTLLGTASQSAIVRQWDKSGGGKQ